MYKIPNGCSAYINVIISHTAGKRLNTFTYLYNFKATMLLLALNLALQLHPYSFTCGDTYCAEQEKKRFHIFSQHFRFQNSDNVVIQYQNRTWPLNPKLKGRGEKERKKKGLYSADIWEIFSSLCILHCQGVKNVRVCRQDASVSSWKCFAFQIKSSFPTEIYPSWYTLISKL